MTPASLTAPERGRWRLAGSLDFGSVSRLAEEGRSLLDDAKQRTIVQIVADLSGVASANSAGLALLLEWMEMAQQRGIHLSFSNLPQSLQRIAAFSNLHGLLPADA